jgi:hypothetical protein
MAKIPCDPRKGPCPPEEPNTLVTEDETLEVNQPIDPEESEEDKKED